MSEKGVLSKSIASNISEAIIEKLGGAGYTPTEWSKNINLLGIASADIEEALASITEDASSSDKGLLSLSIASDVGAMLNKKYNTSRGFKPCEVSSAVSALTPLPEKTASSSPIASFSDGADDVPTKSLVVTIPPTLSGVSSVVETHTEKTIFYPTDIEQGAISGSGYNSNSTTRIRTAERKAVTPSTEYKIKVNSEVQIYEVHEYTDLTSSSTHLTVNASEYTFTTKSTTNYLRILFRYSNNATILPSAITSLQVTDDWETYTASLGRTIYGGYADIVSGVGTETHNHIDMGSLSWTYHAPSGNLSAYFDTYLPNDAKVGNNQEAFDGYTADYTSIKSSQIALSGYDDMVMALGNGTRRFFLCDQRYTDADDLKNALTGEILVYPLATPVDFTFNGQEIPTKDGYNAFWSDEGDTEVTYRADLDLYEAPSTLLGSNNTETEGNEEQEENE